jgi:hypothetical protein
LDGFGGKNNRKRRPRMVACKPPVEHPLFMRGTHMGCIMPSFGTMLRPTPVTAAVIRAVPFPHCARHSLDEWLLPRRSTMPRLRRRVTKMARSEGILLCPEGAATLPHTKRNCSQTAYCQDGVGRVVQLCHWIKIRPAASDNGLSRH